MSWGFTAKREGLATIVAANANIPQDGRIEAAVDRLSETAPEGMDVIVSSAGHFDADGSGYHSITVTIAKRIV